MAGDIETTYARCPAKSPQRRFDHALPSRPRPENAKGKIMTFESGEIAWVA